MKTTTDIAAFVKRVARDLMIHYDGKTERFHVDVLGHEADSKYLDDALENLAESMRRKANDMQPVRETKAEPAPNSLAAALNSNATYAPWTAPPASSSLPSIHQAAQQAYQQQAARINGVVPSCPSCGLLPNMMSGMNFENVRCRKGHDWSAVDGSVYVFDNGERFTYNASGTWITNKWVKQP